LASSSEVYGDRDHVKLHEDMPVSIDMGLRTRINYPVSKLVTEAYGLTYHEIYQLNITILRIFNIIGPGQMSAYGMVVPRFIEAAKDGKVLKVFGDGQQMRTFCDVRDFIGFVSELRECQGSIGQIVNIGGVQPIKILDLAQLIIQLSRSSSNIEFVSYEHAYHQHQDFVQYRCPDLSRLFSWVTYRHQFPLRNTLEELISNER
jgi:UDP-glucose 4-epimerase